MVIQLQYRIIIDKKSMPQSRLSELYQVVSGMKSESLNWTLSQNIAFAGKEVAQSIMIQSLTIFSFSQG